MATSVGLIGGGEGGGGGGGGFGGGFSIPDFSGVFEGEHNSAPWDERAEVERILGIDLPKSIWGQLSDGFKRELRQLARAIWLRAVLPTMPDYTGSRAAATIPPQIRDAYFTFQREGTLPTIPQLSVVLLGILRALGVIRDPVPPTPKGQKPRGRVTDAVAKRALPNVPGRGAPTVPVDYPTIPGPTGEPEPAWLTLLRVVLEQIAAYRQRNATLDFQRKQRRALEMGLADSFGNVLSSAITAAPAVLQTVFNAKAQEQALQQQIKLAKLQQGSFNLLGGGGALVQSPNYSGVPLPSTGALAGTALGMLFGEEPGVLAQGGILERMGLEGDVERTATLWKRTAGGFRAARSITATNPSSGSLNTWLSMGRPILYTGDLAACKRVNKIASRVARVARKRNIIRRRTRRN